MADVTRREFLHIAFGTVSAAALSGPLALIWPEQARSRPVAEPWLVEVEEDYLFDPEWDESSLPTYREHWGYDSLSIKGKIDALLEHRGYDEDDLAADYEIIKPPTGWDSRSLEEIEAVFDYLLDDRVDPERLGMYEYMTIGPYAVGGELLDIFEPEEQEALGLYLVEGDHPGSDFCGVRFDGDVDELNEALACRGINIRVRG